MDLAIYNQQRLICHKTQKKTNKRKYPIDFRRLFITTYGRELWFCSILVPPSNLQHFSKYFE